MRIRSMFRRSGPTALAVLAAGVLVFAATKADATGCDSGSARWNGFAERQKGEIAEALRQVEGLGCSVGRRTPACVMLGRSIGRMERNLVRIEEVSGGDGCRAAAAVSARPEPRTVLPVAMPKPRPEPAIATSLQETAGEAPAVKRPVRIVGPQFFPDL